MSCKSAGSDREIESTSSSSAASEVRVGVETIFLDRDEGMKVLRRLVEPKASRSSCRERLFLNCDFILKNKLLIDFFPKGSE